MLHKSDYIAAGVPVVNPANIVNGAICTDKIMYISSAKAQELSKYLLSNDDILLARRGDLSKCAIVTNNNVGWLCGTGSFVMHLCLVESRYFLYVYATQYIQSFLNAASVGATMDNLNQDAFSNILIPIPPKNEQQRIINEIRHWFDLIDNINNSKQDLVEIIGTTKSKVLDLAIHGKLVPQDPNDEPARELLKRIAPHATPCDTSHYENLPSGWAVCRLEDIVDYEQPTQYLVQSTNYSDNYKTPVLTAGKSFILGYTNETTGIYDKLPTIIFDDFTTDSRFVDFPFKVKSSAMKILQVNKEINIRYVAYFMSITRLVGDTHKRYWISEYSKIPIPLPPINEQNRIAQTIQDIEAKLNEITAEL